MLDRLASAIARFPLAILFAGLLVAAGAGTYGASAPQYLKGGGYLTDDAESSVAAAMLGGKYQFGLPNFYVLLTSDQSIDSQRVRAVAAEVSAQIEQTPGLTGFVSAWSSPGPIAAQLRSSDSRSALLAVQVLGTDNDAPRLANDLQSRLTGTRDGVTITCGGYALIGQQIDQQARKDLILAEAIAIPITALVLIWIFGSLVAALLPLLIGVFSATISLASLRALTNVADVSVFAMNMVTALSLALAIDYSLLTVTRFREELSRGHDPSEAMRRTVRSAGRTVLFSAVTVGCGLGALVVFPQYFLRTFAYAGLCVVASSALASVLFVPAALRLLGFRVNAADVRRWFGRPPIKDSPTDNVWYRTALRVARRPGTVTIVVVAALAVLVTPFAHIRFGVPDDRVIAGSASSRVVGDAIRDEFPRDPAATSVAILPDFGGPDQAVVDYAQALSAVPGVGTVLSSVGIFASGAPIHVSAPIKMSRDLILIQSNEDPYSQAGANQIRLLRAVPSPVPALFAGAAAANVDLVDSMRDGLPTAALILVISTFVLLFLLTRSVLLPLKAIVLNTLSLTAAFGAIVWIFQDGHFSRLIGVTPSGYIVPAMLILMFCLAFGMSMDYEIFVLSRIREEWLESERDTAANQSAVALGIGRSGRIVTVAALLMAIVFAAMVTSRIALMQMFGLGLAIMAATDALIVRSLLVPAIMHFLGTWNWWPHDRRKPQRKGSSDDCATLAASRY
ncbi:MMPL family transporter [Smaragdicoccus niigatensis]|uniref:MMPL family transporter n=1 Tax=Smaragdicoccus niigatensis TaxID=359359 RepID=UPI00037D22E8|nr:MMPL family transporter [Smaragdicoccus niigatensis]